MRSQQVTAFPEYGNFSDEVKHIKSNEHVQLVFTTDQADMGASRLAFWASVDGSICGDCRDVWRCVL